MPQRGHTAGFPDGQMTVTTPGLVEAECGPDKREDHSDFTFEGTEIVDDHPVMRAGAPAAWCWNAPADTFHFCGEAGTPGEARELVIGENPGSSRARSRHGRARWHPAADAGTAGPLQPTLRILVYTSLKEDSYARRALRARARGVI